MRKQVVLGFAATPDNCYENLQSSLKGSPRGFAEELADASVKLELKRKVNIGTLESSLHI